MHLLPGLLTLLFLAAPCRADERLAPYFGDWTGKVTTSANDCAWQVRLRFRPEGESLRGSFTYTGPCAKKPGTGYFNATDGGKACLQGMLSIPGFPGMNGEACFDRDNNIVFKSGLGGGKLSLSEGGSQADLQARSPLGTAEGVFNKLEPKKARKAAKKGKNDEKKGKSAPPPPEILIGSY